MGSEMATMRALTSAENAITKAKRAVVGAQGDLDKATFADPRYITTLVSPNDVKRKRFEEAVANLREAQRVLQEARDKAAKLQKATNGKAKANGAPRVTRQSARGALQNAIAAEKHAKAGVERIRKAIDSSYTQSAAARRKLESAERDLKKAPERDAEAAAQAVAAGKPPPAPTLPKVQAKVTEAENVIEQIRVGRERLEQRQREAERAHEEAKHQVQTAIDDVLRTEWPLAELLDEVARLSERRAVKLLMLRAWSAFATSEERRLIEQAMAAPQPGTVDEEWRFAQHPATLAIAQTRAALAVDASAPIEKL
jgi:DNA repair exonuclease SbcCD ATPase subunit